MKVKKRRRISLFSLLIIALLIVGIGYASINSVILEMAGTVRAEVPKNVFITNVQYVSDVDANTTNSKIKNYLGTMMQSTVELSKTNPNSEIVYKVTVYNNSTKTGTFLDVIYDQANYDNQDIVYEIQDSGFKIDDTIAPKEKKDILIKFKYKDSTLATNNVLNSYLNFKIAEPNMLMQVSSSGNYFGAVNRTKIEKISFELGTIPKNYTQSFDASANQDKSIMGYVTDTDSNNMYEITFSSDAPIFANTNSSYLFYNLTKLTNISFNNFRTTTATDMAEMFKICRSLVNLDLSKFNTSNVTDMKDMFYYCSSLANLDVSNFNTAKVTDMSMMFNVCSSLVNLDLSNFNTANVTDMQFMFAYCSSLTSLDVSNFNPSQVTNMYRMFYECRKLIELDVSNFNTRSVTNMSEMFYYCNSLVSLDLSNFDTSQVTNMDSMFNYCNSLVSLDLSNFDTSQVTSMDSMFYHCNSLVSLDLSNFDTRNVTNMDSMFYECSSLTSLDVSNFNTSNVELLSWMFYNCSKLTNLDVSRFDTSNAGSLYGMFHYCSSLTHLDVSGFNTAGVINMSYMFAKCSSLTSLDVSKFDTAKVINMSYMFDSCSKLTSLDVSRFDTSQVTNMTKMFNGCSKLTSLNVSSFNTSQVTSMSEMFYSCSSLTNLDISNFDTSKVTNMSGMFRACSKLTSLDVSSFDTSKVTNMSYMFSSCSSLTTIYASDSFNTDNVTSSGSMFNLCSSLKGGNGTSYNSSYIDKTYARIDKSGTPGYFTKKNSVADIAYVQCSVQKRMHGNTYSKVGMYSYETSDNGIYGTFYYSLQDNNAGNNKNLKVGAYFEFKFKFYDKDKNELTNIHNDLGNIKLGVIPVQNTTWKKCSLSYSMLLKDSYSKNMPAKFIIAAADESTYVGGVDFRNNVDIGGRTENQFNLPAVFSNINLYIYTEMYGTTPNDSWYDKLNFNFYINGERTEPFEKLSYSSASNTLNVANVKTVYDSSYSKFETEFRKDTGW